MLSNAASRERDTQSLVGRLGVPVYTPRRRARRTSWSATASRPSRPATAAPTCAGLLADDSFEKHLYLAGDRLPIGIEVFPGRQANDVVLWIEDHHAVVAGDTLVDFGQGLEIPAQWLDEGVTREQTAEPLRPLLELPVEHVLTAHGAPTDRAALERALA